MVVYRILNKRNKMVYIGSTNNAIAREREHFSQLANGVHSNSKLQSHYNIYGRSAFVFEILIDGITNREQLLLKEYALIHKHKNHCYNQHFDCPVFDTTKKQDWSMFIKAVDVEVNPVAQMKLAKERQIALLKKSKVKVAGGPSDILKNKLERELTRK